MTFDQGIFTNIGDSKINEDYAAFFVNEKISAYVLADGLGGHGGGDIASHLVVEEVEKTVRKASKVTVELLEQCFESAQDRLIAKQKELKREGAMKTTLVIILTDGKTAVFGHIGDSRLYYISKGKVKYRTLDHSVPQMLVRMKKIKEKDIRHHDERNVLLKVMGIPWSSGKMYEIDEKGMKLKKGDAFVLCSDGLWEWVEDDRIAQITSQNNSASMLASELCDEAYSNGLGTERDNITALVLKVTK